MTLKIKNDKNTNFWNVGFSKINELLIYEEVSNGEGEKGTMGSI